MSYRTADDCGARCLGATPMTPAWLARSAMLPHMGRRPSGSFGRNVMHQGTPSRAQLMLQPSSTGLGFSFRPPKWLRKAQPGKILAKAAIPLAVIGGALLIPGVGGAIVGAATGAVKGAGSLLKMGGSAIASSLKPVTNTVGTSVANTLQPLPAQVVTNLLTPTPPMGSPNPAIVPPQTFNPAPQVAYGPPMVSSGAGASSFAPAGPGGEAPAGAQPAGELPSWAIPAGIAAVALLVMSRR